MEIRYYTKEIEKFIKLLDNDTASGITRLILLLAKCGNKIKMPYSKSLSQGLFELRRLGKRQVRVLYCFHNGEAVILHIFEKKANSVSRKDLTLARQRKDSLA